MIGRFNLSPILDTLIYELEFEDSQVATYVLNISADNIYEQVDEDGNAYTLLESILDHKKRDTAVE
jgi:hypothetical protein